VDYNFCNSKPRPKFDTLLKGFEITLPFYQTKIKKHQPQLRFFESDSRSQFDLKALELKN